LFCHSFLTQKSSTFAENVLNEDYMADIVIYTRDYCPYCHKAKALLTRKGVKFTEIDLEKTPQKHSEMVQKAGGRTSVPQIFINNQHIGGSDDIHALDAQGGLDPLLL
jgi:glutaredoxin 3